MCECVAAALGENTGGLDVVGRGWVCMSVRKKRNLGFVAVQYCRLLPFVLDWSFSTK